LGFSSFWTRKRKQHHFVSRGKTLWTLGSRRREELPSHHEPRIANRGVMQERKKKGSGEPRGKPKQVEPKKQKTKGISEKINQNERQNTIHPQPKGSANTEGKKKTDRIRGKWGIFKQCRSSNDSNRVGFV